MTLSTTTAKVGYLGNGTTTAFAVPFAFFAAAELEVVERVIATGVETPRALTTHYTVTGGNGSTGTVTAVAAPPATVTWTIARKTARTQLTDYLTGDAFPAETHERALDRLTALVQEIEEILGRSLRIPITDVGSTPQLPSSTARANKVLVFDSAGQPGVSDAAALASVTAAAYASVQEFVGDGTTTVFVLNSVPGSTAMVDVSVGGIVQSPSLDYGVAGNELTFSAAPPNGAQIVARWITSSGSVGNFVPISATQGSTSEVRANGRFLWVQGVGNGGTASGFARRATFSGSALNTFGNVDQFEIANGTPSARQVPASGSGIHSISWLAWDGGVNAQAATFRAEVVSTPASGGLFAELSWAVGPNAKNVSLRQQGQWRFHPMTAPASPLAGDVYYDSGTNKLRCWNGTTWNDLF